MAGGEVSKISKPQLRGLLTSQIKKNVIIAVALSAVGAVLYKTLINDNRKRAYAEYFKDFDIDQRFNEMRNKGLFDSCEPDN